MKRFNYILYQICILLHLYVANVVDFDLANPVDDFLVWFCDEFTWEILGEGSN